MSSRSFTVTSPTVTGYTPNRSSVSGTYGDGNHSVYYYEKSYTVSYNANGGSGAPASQTKTYGTTLTLSSPKPTRSGYTFSGWMTANGGSTAAVLTNITENKSSDKVTNQLVFVDDLGGFAANCVLIVFVLSL